MEEVIYSRNGRFDFLEHTGDIYVRAYGGNILELFENAGLALFDSMTNIDGVNCVVERDLLVEGFDLENLLYRWLEELLVLYYSERLMCGWIRVDAVSVERHGDGFTYRLKARVSCEEFDPSRHEARVEVKSPTYSLMRILKDEDKWIAYFVLDI
ncbi:archease family protein [Desulfurococcus mucosus DSM 2162]|uniref:Archease family protein n=2 Tax=Desulfurococcus mucosus TaxID=2275 RepID=E8RAK4_DESM0|nr:archease family protein [Desulfurococcus mucosus DSM 2162]